MIDVPPGYEPPPPELVPFFDGPYLDERTRRYYYFDTRTGETEWLPLLESRGNHPGNGRMSAGRGSVDMCADFRMGKCNRGANCKFSHGDDRLRNMPSEPMVPMHAVMGPRPVCGDWKAGKCMRGKDCRFAHEMPECADYKRGTCTRGADCRYVHERIVECADFKRGRCNRENCKYEHIESRERSRSR